MGAYRVCVYAICKNEAKFAKRFMDSVSEADDVVVLDTGSDDDSVKLLTGLGAHVYTEKIEPWRFDTARNRALALVPENTDICVSIDLDEVFRPSWREKVEAAWAKGADMIKYRYTWSFNPDGSEGVVFWINKIHARHGFRWINPVHEVLTHDGPIRALYAEGVQVDHLSDPTKSRAQYLPLLELSVQEDPDNDRNMHYLGREYLFNKKWQACIDTLKRHLSMPKAIWPDERCASMRFIARAEVELGHAREAEQWLLRACAEAPYLREPWLDYARLLYLQNNFYGMVFLAQRALEIAERPRSYVCEADAWGFLPYDLLSLGLFYTGQKERALEAAREALRLAPYVERLKNNVACIEAALAQEHPQA